MVTNAATDNDDKSRSSNSNRKATVAARWKLLRDALQGKPVSRKPTFAGYNMVASQRITIADDDGLYDELKTKLLSITLSCCLDEIVSTLVDTLETSLLGLHALGDFDNDMPSELRERNHAFSIAFDKGMDHKCMNLELISKELCQRCGFDTCTLQWIDNKDTDSFKAKNLHISATVSNQNRFLIRRYNLIDSNPRDESSSFLLVRERSPEQVISMAELTSHRRGHAVDNTGNVCVWDCEKTLLWALLQSDRKFQRVLELGAGMAGLVGLGLGAAIRASEVIVTDGNPTSLQSNRTHVRLMEAKQPLQCMVHARLLPWALQASEEGEVFRDLEQQYQADLSVVSDCTHFERYHGNLFWTLIQCTAIGGEIWMCHPNRGETLDRFLDMVQLFALHDATNGAPRPEMLLSMKEVTFLELGEKHKQLLRNDPNYCPNIHKPRIFCLSKLRQATENDRNLIVQHMATRNADRKAGNTK